MIMKSYFTESPATTRFETLPGKKNRVWMRRNIKEQEVPTDSTGKNTEKQWVADEVYFETVAGCEEITANEDKWYAYGSTWTEGTDEPDILTNKELTETCSELQNQQLDLYDAVATIYESMGV